MLQSELDGTDLRILAALQEEGRLTNQAVSEQVGLSPSPCLRRVRRMERDGVIRRYVALVDPDALGLGVTAFVRVRLAVQNDQHLERFEQAVAHFPEVMDCHLMSGESDYQLRVLVRSLSEFEEFMRGTLTKIAEISEITTSFALRTVIARTALPLAG